MFFFSLFFDQRFLPTDLFVDPSSLGWNWFNPEVLPNAGDGRFSTIQTLFCWGTGEFASKTRTRGVVSVELRLQNHIHQEKNAFVSLLIHPSMDSFQRKCLCFKIFTKRRQPSCLHVGEPLGVPSECRSFKVCDRSLGVKKPWRFLFQKNNEEQGKIWNNKTWEIWKLLLSQHVPSIFLFFWEVSMAVSSSPISELLAQSL